MIIRDGKAAENPALGIQQRAAAAMASSSRALGLDKVPIAGQGQADPVAGQLLGGFEPPQPRWCDEHQRNECRHRRQDGQPCHQFKLVSGLDVCRKHGGKTLEQLRADGQARLVEADAAKALARLDAPPVVNPFEELARLAGQCVAWKDSMGGKVNELTSIRYEGGIGTEQLRAEIAVWERALDRCLAALSAMARLNIESRLAGIRQATLTMLEEALTAALQQSGLDVYEQNKARQEFQKRIRVVA
jgi:hypothetical protein